MTTIDQVLVENKRRVAMNEAMVDDLGVRTLVEANIFRKLRAKISAKAFG